MAPIYQRGRQVCNFLGSSCAIFNPWGCTKSFSTCTSSTFPAMDAANSSPAVPKKCFADGYCKGKIVAAESSKPLTCELLIQNYANFKRSSSPARFMFYDNGSWVDYPKELAEVMKLGFVEGKPMVEARVLGFNCLIDFWRMLEIEVDSGNYRSVSWIDVDGKCFFPKFFVNSSENSHENDDVVNFNEACPKIHVDIKVRDNSVSFEAFESNKIVNSNKRKREEYGENVDIEGSSCSSNVKKRQMVESESDSPRWEKARILRPEEKAFQVIKNLFLTGVETVEKGAKVTSIHQCMRERPLDEARHELFAKQMEIMEQARGKSNVVFAWYGTSAKGVESILMHGFGIPTELSRPEGYGIGIPLSSVRLPGTSAKRSPIDRNGEKHVLLCRVILGKCEKVEAGSLQSYPSSAEYDTGVDDLSNPRWYTVWHPNMNTHILPEYVISYRPANVSGSANGMTKVNWVPQPSVFVAKLLSRLKSSLSMTRFQELHTLWASYKKGDLRKDNFVKQLRYVVGDDILRAAIQEIRG